MVFLLTFDGKQMRYAGNSLLDILLPIGHGNLLPPAVAVEVLASTILRLDPTGSILTTTHILLTKLAYSTGHIEPALAVIDKSIVFYPGMPDRNIPEFFCDLGLSPASYMTKNAGLTNAVKATAVLEYDLLCGLMYCTRKDWAKAHASFERVITYPTRDQGTSKIMVEAYKKWVLVGLLHNGRYVAPPSYTGSGASKIYETFGKPYRSIAAIFETDVAAQLKEETDRYVQLWQEDGNLGLIHEVITSYQMWQVLKLQQVYSKISISQIRRQTTSAQTGTTLKRDDEVETLIQTMVVSGMLNGVIEKNDDGTAFLAFLPLSTIKSEAEFARELAASAIRLKALKSVFKATNERLGTNKEYIKHLVKMEHGKDNKNDPEPWNTFNSQVDDEDLMGGITSTA